MLDRVRRSFNADKVTRNFYKQFHQQHLKFAKKIDGLPKGHACRWYASVLLNRLMFIYFVQNRGFLDGDSELPQEPSHPGPRPLRA